MNTSIKVLICSVHFGAGHTAHLQAYQKLSEECGYETALYLHQNYMKLFSNIQGKLFFREEEVKEFRPDVVWIYNTGTENLKLIKMAKELHSKIVYVLHELYMGFKELMKDGSYWYKEAAASLLNDWICKSQTELYSVANVQHQTARSICLMHIRKKYIFH